MFDLNVTILLFNWVTLCITFLTVASIIKNVKEYLAVTDTITIFGLCKGTPICLNKISLTPLGQRPKVFYYRLNGCLARHTFSVVIPILCINIYLAWCYE